MNYIDDYIDEIISLHKVVDIAYSYFEKWIGAPAEIETNNPMSYAVLGPTNMVALFKEKLSATNNTPLRWLDKYGLEESDDNLDNDLDGYKTWQEYICDTDPTNRFSYLKGLRINRENGELIVRQPETSLDRDYYLNVSTNLLNSAGWVEKTNAPGNGADIIYNRTPDLDLKAIFYRGGVRLKE